MSSSKKALRILLTGVAINLSIGLLYAWSVIKKALMVEWGWTNQDATLPYTVAIVVFAAGLLIAGVIQDRFGPRNVVTTGTVLVGSGMIASSLIDNVFGLVITFGCIVGTGVGFAYACVSPAAMKWFHPSKKGMVNGLIVGGFGMGAVYLAPVTTSLISQYGISKTFLMLGIFVLVVAVPLSRIITNPPADYVPPAPKVKTDVVVQEVPTNNLTWREVIKTRQFYFLWVMFVFSSSAGVMIIGTIATIADKQAGITNAAYLVAVLAVFNTSGRVLGGILSDKIGRTNTMILVFVVQAINMLCFAMYQNEAMILVGTAVAGLCYGPLLSVFPSVTADYYGLKGYGTNYGVLYTAWGVSGFVGPLIAAKAMDVTNSMGMAYNISAGLLVVCVVFAFLTKPVTAKEPESVLDGSRALT